VTRIGRRCAALAAALVLGCESKPPPEPRSEPRIVAAPAPAAAASAAAASAPVRRHAASAAPIEPMPGVVDAAGTAESILRSRRPSLPVAGVGVGGLRDMFADARGGRPHEALDIAAPRGTPVHAVDDGTVAKLFTSVPGGLTVYQFDPSGRIAYYYAHLDRYADGLKEGAALRRCDVIGYVGSTGNASAEAPHLHFAVFGLGLERRWWEGVAINPHPALVAGGGRACR